MVITNPPMRVRAPNAMNPPLMLKKKKCVAAKQSTRRRWPTIMFSSSRRANEIGRTMKMLMNSIGVNRMYMYHGTPAGNSAFRKNVAPPTSRKPA